MLQINLVGDGLAKLKRFSHLDIEDRVRALRRLILYRIVETLFKEVLNGIPDSNEKWLQTYKDSLAIYEVDDLEPDSDALAIMSRVEGDWTLIESKRSLIYFKTDERSPFVEIGKILEKYAPFVADAVPNLKKYGAFPVVTLVRKDDVINRREENEKESSTMAAELDKAGMVMLPGPAVIQGKVLFDLPAAIIQLERGHSGRGKAHWRPAFRHIPANLNLFLKSVISRKKLVRILFDSRYNGWKKELKPKYKTVRLNDIKGMEEASFVIPNF